MASTKIHFPTFFRSVEAIWRYDSLVMDNLRIGREPDDYALSPSLRWACALMCAVAVLWTVPLAAQANHGSAIKEPGSLIRSPLPHVPDDRVTGPDKDALPVVAPDESCFMWPLTGTRSPTSGVSSLEVPGQTRKEFQHACGAVSDKKVSKAEGYLRKALRADPQYPAAWVLLGQILKAQQKPEEARNACSQALKVDPNYLPADLCMADLCAAQQKWEEMLGLPAARSRLIRQMIPTAISIPPAHTSRCISCRLRRKARCEPPKLTRLVENRALISCWHRSMRSNTSQTPKPSSFRST